MKNKMITKTAAILAIGLLAFGLTACGSTENNTETTNSTTDTTGNATDTTEQGTDTTPADETAQAAITIEVTDAEGNTSTYTGTTDDEFLLGAIEDIEGVTIDGYESDWGYYVTTVNGITADYDTDGSYWSLYVNGAYGQNGVSTEPVADGAVYSFVYDVYVEETTPAAGVEITIEVTDAEGNTTTFTGNTDDEFLFGAIEDIEGVTIDGYESDWGYYITTVNDIVADYDTDGAYWAIYVNGEFGSNGVETQPITEGDVYGFVYTAAAN